METPKANPSILDRIAEADVAAWMLAKIEQLRIGGMPIDYVDCSATFYDHRVGTDDAPFGIRWGMQGCGACVTSEPTCDGAFVALRRIATEQSVANKRAEAARLLKDADALEALKGSAS